MNQHWATIKEAGALKGMRIMVFIYTVFGRGVFNLILVPVMAYFFVRRTIARKASMAYLRKVEAAYPGTFGKQPIAWLSFRHFLSFGHSLLDKYIALSQTPTDIAMDQEEENMLFDLVNSKKGCLVIGSHFGNLEYSRGIAVRHPELVINVLMYDQHAENFSALMKGVKTKSRMNLMQVTDIDMALALDLRERVQRGEWVVIAGDRVPVGDGNRVCRARFFGEDANFPIGPYVLAHLLACPIYLLHCYLVDDDYRIGVELFEEKFQIGRGDRQKSYETAAGKFAQLLEKQVVRFPLQWFNFFDFWQNSDERQTQGGKQ